MVKQYMRTTANWQGGKFMKFEELLKQGKKSMENEQKKRWVDFFNEAKAIIEKTPIFDSCSVACIDFSKKKAIFTNSSCLYGMIHGDYNFLDACELTYEFSKEDYHNPSDLFHIEKVFIAFSENSKVFIRVSESFSSSMYTYCKENNIIALEQYFDEQLSTFNGYEGIVKNSLTTSEERILPPDEMFEPFTIFSETVTVKFDLSFFQN